MMSQPPLPIAILAGGLATRLRPITETIPKALVPVQGRPFLAHQLHLLRQHGLREIVLCVGYLGEQIVQEIGNGHAFDLHVQYSFDGPELRGTAGAIRQALPLLGRDFFVLYGDSYLEIDYQAIQQAYRRGSGSALMTVMENSAGPETSNVWYENDRVRVYHKHEKHSEMHHIDYGLSLYSASVFEEISAPDLSEVQRQLAEQGRLDGYLITTPYHEIGSPSGLKAFEQHLTSKPS